MATTITCDCCKAEILKPLKVVFNDGEDGHNHNPIKSTKDLCVDCFGKLKRPPISNVEWNEFTERNHNAST